MNIPLFTYTLMYSIEISWVLKSSFKYEAIVLQATQVSMKKKTWVHCTVKQGRALHCQARLYIILSSKAGVHCTVKQGCVLYCQARACIVRLSTGIMQSISITPNYYAYDKEKSFYINEILIRKISFLNEEN